MAQRGQSRLPFSGLFGAAQVWKIPKLDREKKPTEPPGAQRQRDNPHRPSPMSSGLVAMACLPFSLGRHPPQVSIHPLLFHIMTEPRCCPTPRAGGLELGKMNSAHGKLPCWCGSPTTSSSSALSPTISRPELLPWPLPGCPYSPRFLFICREWVNGLFFF